MNIILDAMGGDKAPLEVVKGAAKANRLYDANLTLVGNREIIQRIAKEQDLSLSGIRIEHTEEVITMEDDPLSVVRSKKNSSMSVALRLLKDGEGDALVSAGNTGALHAGSSLIIRPIKGVQRAAIATVLPMAKPVLMLDCGANTTVTLEYMTQWAAMGSIYMQNVFSVPQPAVALLNNGAEAHKGTPVVVETYKKLTESKFVRFIGNVEGNQLTSAPCDVLITDGFTGNITLKLLEGLGKYFSANLVSMYTKNAATKLSYLVVKDGLKEFKKQFDASEYGGAPFLGLQKPVIKAHGSSDARAICNAVRQAMTFVRTGVISEITEYIAATTSQKNTPTPEEDTAHA